MNRQKVLWRNAETARLINDILIHVFFHLMSIYECTVLQRHSGGSKRNSCPQVAHNIISYVSITPCHLFINQWLNNYPLHIFTEVYL